MFKLSLLHDDALMDVFFNDNHNGSKNEKKQSTALLSQKYMLLGHTATLIDDPHQGKTIVVSGGAVTVFFFGVVYSPFLTLEFPN